MAKLEGDKKHKRLSILDSIGPVFFRLGEIADCDLNVKLERVGYEVLVRYN